jgi:hypothetical protein
MADEFILLTLIVRKKRFFILRSDIRELCYYVSEDQLTLIGSIAIDANTIVWNVNAQDGEPVFTPSLLNHNQ